MPPDWSADLVVVGSGVAGLAATRAAVQAGASVLLLTGGPLLAGSSPRAQGGVAAALGPDDAPTWHAADTVAVGAGLNDPRAVRILVHEGRRAARDLLAAGVPFDRGLAGPALGLEAGHRRRRVLRAAGGATGRALTVALLAEVVEHPRVRVVARSPAEGLLFAGPRVVGVRSGGLAFTGRAVVLATGGYAALWARTTNGPETRGTGIMLAYDAGATLADLEFVQFHPTALDLPGCPAFLFSEALRGEGAQVVDARERPIVDPLLPRDVLARAIFRYGRERGPVFLSLRRLDPDFVCRRFSSLAAEVRAWGLDLARDLLPIAPAAHYCMGGVRTDTAGRTDVAGLYVAGEAACTGAQGANRLASNSLLECLVFGARAARAALGDGRARRARWRTDACPAATERSCLNAARGTVSAVDQLGPALDRDLGVERRADGLAALVAALPHPDDDAAPAEARLAALAARAALLRRESRGSHFRSDVPESDPAWRGRIHWRRGAEPRFEEVVG